MQEKHKEVLWCVLFRKILEETIYKKQLEIGGVFVKYSLSITDTYMVTKALNAILKTSQHIFRNSRFIA